MLWVPTGPQYSNAQCYLLAVRQGPWARELVFQGLPSTLSISKQPLARKTGRKLFEVKTHMATGLQKDYEPSELSTIGSGLLILRVTTEQFREQCVQTGLAGE